ncbi:MAG: hypothetical protein FVQ81_08785 [Candidatus Glassbacteria bacterium]|nr:hypothetical protein [Candidatus Glassbacteria bacterium]
MDDSLERDQLNLWEKLNHLYGDEPQEGSSDADSQAGEPGADTGEPVQPGNQQAEAVEENRTGDTGRRGELGSAALDEVDMTPVAGAVDGPGAVNTICVDCRYDCKQPAAGFVISRCRLAVSSQQESRAVTPNQLAASQGSMGIEKINETCRRCRRSCKQRTVKLNKMLCLEFLPIENGPADG